MIQEIVDISLVLIQTSVALLWLAAATASITMTISRAKVFKGLRLAIKQHCVWLYELISCPYCLSHWVALFLVFDYRPFILHGLFGIIIDFIVTVFMVVTVASWMQGLIWRAFKGLTLVDEQAITDG